MNYNDIAEKIIELKNRDLELRTNLIKKGELGNAYNPEMKKLHNKNATILNEIIDEIGYPTIKKVGEDANNAAWLVIQHSIEQPDFMKKCAKLMEAEVDENIRCRRHLAYLMDRIAVLEGRPQLYGTQFDWDENGELSPNEITDTIGVDKRRKLIGLNSLEEQKEIIRQEALKENQLQPKDIKKRKAQFDAWRKSVGWIK